MVNDPQEELWGHVLRGQRKAVGAVSENGSQQVFLTPSGSCSSPAVGIRGTPNLISQEFPEASFLNPSFERAWV